MFMAYIIHDLALLLRASIKIAVSRHPFSYMTSYWLATNLPANKKPYYKIAVRQQRL